MIKRIVLKNFMSHEHTEIELGSGLTVLIGPNNVGKSAIIAALQILCYNENSTYVMRHGEKACSVTVETTDGHCIEWQRKKSPSYIIDGQRFDRLGVNRVPDELHPVLRLAKVEADSADPFDVHFGAQKSPIFLLDQSGSSAARFFASSSDAIRLVAMQKRHNDKVRDARKERTRLDRESQLLNLQLAALDPVVDIERQVEQLELSYQQLLELQTSTRELVDTEQNLAQQQRVVARYQTEAFALAPLLPPPQLLATEPLEKLVVEIVTLEHSSRFAELQLAVVKELLPPPQLTETAEITKLTENLTSVQREVQTQNATQSALQGLSLPPLLPPLAPLEQLISELRESATKARYEHQVAESLKTLASAPLLKETQSLDFLLSELTRGKFKFEQLIRQTEILQSVTPLQLQDQDTFSDFVTQFQQSQQACQTFLRQFETLHDLTLPVAAINPEACETLIRELRTVTEQVCEQQQEVHKLQAELVELTQVIKEVANDQNCPVCGGPLDANRLLEQAWRNPA